jgi:hypothetical protein
VIEMEGRIMRSRFLAVKISLAVVAAVPLMGGVANAGGKSVADYVHETMAGQEERGGCEWGRAISAAGADNRQNSVKHPPTPCK